MKIYLTLLLTVIALFGCATSVEQQTVDLTAKAVCCESISEFDYQALVVEDAVRVNIGSQSDVYRFGGEKSYFNAFELPDMTGYRLFLKVYFNGPTIGQYLKPQLVILDSDYAPIKAFVPFLRFKDGTFFGETSAHLHADFELPENSRYLIITSDYHNDTTILDGVPVQRPQRNTESATVITQYGRYNYGLNGALVGNLKIELKQDGE